MNITTITTANWTLVKEGTLNTQVYSLRNLTMTARFEYPIGNKRFDKFLNDHAVAKNDSYIVANFSLSELRNQFREMNNYVARQNNCNNAKMAGELIGALIPSEYRYLFTTNEASKSLKQKPISEAYVAKREEEERAINEEKEYKEWERTYNKVMKELKSQQYWDTRLTEEEKRQHRKEYNRHYASTPEGHANILKAVSKWNKAHWKEYIAERNKKAGSYDMVRDANKICAGYFGISYNEFKKYKKARNLAFHHCFGNNVHWAGVLIPKDVHHTLHAMYGTRNIDVDLEKVKEYCVPRGIEFTIVGDIQQ